MGSFSPARSGTRVVLLLLAAAAIDSAVGHGFLARPVARNAAAAGYRYPGNTKPANAPQGLGSTAWTAKHGMCGNNPTDTTQWWNAPGPVHPTLNQWREGDAVDIVVHVTAHHLGFFEFEVCDSPDISEGCFKRGRLLRDGCTGSEEQCRVSWKPALEPELGSVYAAGYPAGAPVLQPEDGAGGGVGSATMKMRYRLPDGLNCDHCVLRWHYFTTNSCGAVDTHVEEFYNCADVSIAAASGPTRQTAVPAGPALDALTARLERSDAVEDVSSRGNFACGTFGKTVSWNLANTADTAADYWSTEVIDATGAALQADRFAQSCLDPAVYGSEHCGSPRAYRVLGHGGGTAATAAPQSPTSSPTTSGDPPAGGGGTLPEWSEAELAASTVPDDSAACHIALFDADACHSDGGVFRVTAAWYTGHFGGAAAIARSCGKVISHWSTKAGGHAGFRAALQNRGDFFAAGGTLAAVRVASLRCSAPATTTALAPTATPACGSASARQAACPTIRGRRTTESPAAVTTADAAPTTADAAPTTADAAPATAAPGTAPPTGGGGGGSVLPCIGAWGKCGGNGWTGATCCTAGHICDVQSEWYHQCIPGTGVTPPPSPTPTPTPTPSQTPAATPSPSPTKTPAASATATAAPASSTSAIAAGTTTLNSGSPPGSATAAATSSPGDSSCVKHSELVAVNSESSFWPACDPSQAAKAGVAGPAGYIFGHFCGADYAAELSAALSELGLCGGRFREVRRRFLAQVAYETGYFSTLQQPADAGTGMIHMIPGNWRPNVLDMEALFPDRGILADYDSRVTDEARSAFFREPARAWRSAAAWMKLTNRVIPGCGKDLFASSYDEMTRCILGRVVDRSEALALVSKHIGSPSQAPTPAPAPPGPATSPPVGTSPAGASTASTQRPAGTAGPTAPCTPDGSTGFEQVVSADAIHRFFKDWGLNYDGKTGLAAAEQIRGHIACGIRLKPDFGSFCNSGDSATDLREAAAFFANVRKETGGFAKLEESAPHRYCTSDPGSGAGAGLQAAGAEFPCSPGASYHGRGAIQLSWNFNYGRFSKFLFDGDETVLLANPDLVAPASATGWAATLWFWMSAQDYGGTAPPVQLDGCVPRGTMSPHDAMLSAGDPAAAAADPNGAHAGMARTINIINGGWECAVTSPHRSSATARMQSYLDFAAMLGVAPHRGCDSAADCAAKGVQLGAGCPLIEADEGNSCPLVCTQAGAADWTGARRFTCSDCAATAARATTLLSQPCA